MCQTNPVTGVILEIEGENSFARIERAGASWVNANTIPGFSGSGYIQTQLSSGYSWVSDYTQRPEIQYKLNFPEAGRYYLFVRGYSASWYSVYFGLNGERAAGREYRSPQYQPDGSPVPIGATRFNAWYWHASYFGTGGNFRIYIDVPSAGEHTVNIWPHEGYGFAIDKILLAKNKNFFPDYIENFWQKQSIYQIFTDRFFDGDSSNNDASATVSISPVPPVPGSNLTINYFSTNRILASAPAINLHAGHSGWQGVIIQAMVRNGSGWTANLSVPTNASSIQFVFNDGGSLWDNNDGTDWNLPISVTMSPDPPVAGRPVRITYRPVSRPLANASSVNLHLGFNSWANFVGSFPMNQNSSSYTYDYLVPTNATNLSFVFNDGGSVWDNNGGQDWRPATQSTASFMSRRQGGDFKGIEEKLDYIKALGATAIWISPVLYNGKGDYHGYAATDFYKVDPRFGTLDDLKRLVKKAHEKGLLVINDVVVNHGSTLIGSTNTGWQNTFKYPPDGYPLSFEGSSSRYAPPFDASNLEIIFNNNGQTLNWGDAKHVELGELLGLDDFRTESSFVRQKMQEIYSYWIREVGFDGFRIDTAKHVDMSFWDQWSPAMRTAASQGGNSNFFQFGEVYDGDDRQVGKYTGKKGGGEFKLDSVLDYPLFYQIQSVFASATAGTDLVAGRWNRLNADFYDPASVSSLVTFLDNHDQPRFLYTANNDVRNLELGLVFLYTSPGIPCLYYGTEQDFRGGGDPLNREGMFSLSADSSGSLSDCFDMTSERFKLVMKLNLLRKNFIMLPFHHPSSEGFTPEPPTFKILHSEAGPGLLIYGVSGSPTSKSTRERAFRVVVMINTALESRNTPVLSFPDNAALGYLQYFNNFNDINENYSGQSVAVSPRSYRIYIREGWFSDSGADLCYIEKISPRHGLNQVSPSSKIEITFSKPMDEASVVASFSTDPPTSGSFSWSIDKRILTYTPGILTSNKRYVVRIGRTARAATAYAGQDTKLFYNTDFISNFTTGNYGASDIPWVSDIRLDGVSATEASLKFDINPRGSLTSLTLDYGAGASFGSSLAGGEVAAGSTPISQTISLSNLATGTAYQVRLIASNSFGRSTSPVLNFNTVAPISIATTRQALSVQNDGALVAASLQAAEVDTTAFFEYGLDPQQINNSTGPFPVSNLNGIADQTASISGLQPNTTYYYRVVTVSGGNTNRSALQSFTTAAIKPTVDQLGAGPITMNSATLSFSVKPNGFETSAWLEVSTNGSNWFARPAQSVVAGATLGTNISTVVADLVPNQRYLFRGVGSNTHGITVSSNSQFFTPKALPNVQNGPVMNLGSNSAILTGVVEPQGPVGGFWIEYGTGPELGFSSLGVVSDNAESYSDLAYTAPHNLGGSGFGPFITPSQYSGIGGLSLIRSSSSGSSANRQIDGGKSFGVSSGASPRGSHSGYRHILEPPQIGVLEFSVRFDTDNSIGFAGLNLKWGIEDEFSVGELVSLGLMPFDGVRGGNQQIVIGDTNGWQVIDFGMGTDLRGKVLDCLIEFDCLSGNYQAKAKLRSENSFRVASGTMKNYGVDVRVQALGYLNANSTGASDENFIFDNLQLTSYRAVMGGAQPGGVSFGLTSLLASTNYYFRIGAFNFGGTAYGATQSFTTLAAVSGIDAWRQAWFGSPNNTGPAADGASATGDGIANLIKYALDLNPTQPITNPIITGTMTNGTFHLAFTRKKDASDITYRVEAANNLATPEAWEEIWASSTNAYAGGENPTTQQVVQDVIPMNSAPQGKRFLRLTISKP